MTAYELWLEVMGLETVVEVIKVAEEAGETVEATVAVNVQEFVNLCGLPEGETAESIAEKLMQFIAASTKQWYAVTDTDGRDFTELLCGDCKTGYECRNYTVKLLRPQPQTSSDAKCHCGDR